ncbi:helix-turn-helix domain-containing protein [Nocardia sienata]|uniref:helix-turn-helix domain-containing protein n=1 Tax=Nocardia sienata TaxID=248552 RepID=UPI000B247100|nr:helix-turn-helix domain-containing protein [Nocardia sienata]
MFHSENLGEIEAFLRTAYPGVSIGHTGPRHTSVGLRRDVLGPVTLDRIALGFDLSYGVERSDTLCLASVHAGAIAHNGPGGGTEDLTPGRIGLLGANELPSAGIIHAGRYDLTLFDSTLLDRLAAGEGGTPVRITAAAPRTPAATRRLTEAITHLKNLAADPATAGNPLLIATATDYLAATVLATVSTTAVTAPGAADRRDAHPDTVRRAIAYLETNVHDDITVAAVAAAAFVTPRALQLAFRRHLGTTPLRYLQRLRLAGAHERLLAAAPGDGQTVASIARAWGFAHPGRFAAAYYRCYGRSPSDVLHHSG